MKRILILAAVLAPMAAFAQIAGTKHNLMFGGSGTGAVKAANATLGGDQICIFCHTPHKAAATKLLWNRTSANTAGWAALSTLTSTTPLPTSLTASSLACMSCHDGTTSIGTVTNRGGGTGGLIAGAVTTGGATPGAMSLAYTVAPTMDGNHPVSLPYPGSLAAYNTITSAAAVTGYRPILVSATCTSPTNVCTTSPVAADGLAINLTVAGTATGVECAACHDPHGTANTYLLRAPIAGSGLCLACHVK